MNGAVQRYLDAASGLTNLTKSRAEQIAKQLVKSGEAATDQVGDVVDELLERQRRNRDAITTLVKAETQRAVRAMGLATNEELERLQRQVADLRRQLAAAEQDAAEATTAGSASAAPRKAAKKASAATPAKATKKAAKKAARKTAARKTAKKAGGSS